MKDTPLIDAHFHVYTRDMPIMPWAWHHPPEDASAEQFLKVMDDHGVGFGVIAAASLYGDYNDYVIRTCRNHPRFRGTVFVQPGTDMYTLERMKADGIVGIRLFFRRIPNPPDLKSPEYRMLLRRVRDLDWHVHTLVSGEMAVDVIKALEDSGVKLVIDHFGKPDESLGLNCPGFRAICAAVERGRTWVKLSGGFRMKTRAAGPALCAGAAASVGRRTPGLGERLALRRLRGQGHLRRHHCRFPRMGAGRGHAPAHRW